MMHPLKTLALAILAVAFCACRADSLENERMRVQFDTATGAPVSMVHKSGESAGEEMLLKSIPVWELRGVSDSLLAQAGQVKSIRKVGRGTLKMRWAAESGVEVCATVRLDKKDSMLHWGLALKGLSSIEEPVTVCYPVLCFRKMENEDLAVSSWLGRLEKDPRSGIGPEKPVVRFSHDSPGQMSMQMMALYDREAEAGMYLATNDASSYTKNYTIEFDTISTCFKIKHFPAFGEGSFSPAYEVITGPFEGDWLSAAKIYRRWAKEQRWCKQSRLANHTIPEWVLNTGLWVWNRGRSENVLPDAVHLQQESGLPVSVLWHWWCGCGHDEDFPHYLPPREGAESFRDAVQKAASENLNSLVYINSFRWGTSVSDWEDALPYSLKKASGEPSTAVSNAFTRHEIAAMCLACDYWTDRYVGMADTLLRDYGVGGIYMDEACLALRCFDPNHGHPLSGGSYWYEDFSRMASRIREKDAGAVLAGEGSGEDWISDLDLFLTLAVSRERYIGGDAEAIPLFQAVYHDYAISFGSYSSLVYPPYDELWPAEHRPKGCETLLPDRYNMQFRMEQARSFVFGMQPMIANYHAFLDEMREPEMDFLRRLAETRREYAKYLLFGEMERTPAMDVPYAEIDISKVSIYAFTDGKSAAEIKKNVPLLYSGMWKAKDGESALFIVNICDEPQRLAFADGTEIEDPWIEPRGIRVIEF
ncbi:MAG: hypothetical protein J6X57_01345 [Bacteroidales bacterium]|nr:hypothetical protein [Bacteroidales bacterium]